MLKNIPSLLSPDLFRFMMDMGHGDELVLADGNYNAWGRSEHVLRADGLGVPALLDAVLRFFPLDDFVEHPAVLMETGSGNKTGIPIWDEYRSIVKNHEPGFKDFEYMERFAFYERARKSYATVVTGEKALYANIILKKGVVVET